MPHKACAICGKQFEKPPSCSKSDWEHKRRFCSKACAVEGRRGRPNPKVAAALRGQKQSPERIAKRVEVVKKAHAEGRMGDYSWFKGLKGEQTTQWKGDRAGYRAVHQRLVNERGKAKEHSCVDCGRPAHDWSHKGGAGAFTTDLDDYEPRCRSCHLSFDGRERDPRTGRLL